jgi:hypothetical protein
LDVIGYDGELDGRPGKERISQMFFNMASLLENMKEMKQAQKFYEQALQYNIVNKKVRPTKQFRFIYHEMK